MTLWNVAANSILPFTTYGMGILTVLGDKTAPWWFGVVALLWVGMSIREYWEHFEARRAKPSVSKIVCPGCSAELPKNNASCCTSSDSSCAAYRCLCGVASVWGLEPSPRLRFHEKCYKAQKPWIELNVTPSEAVQ